MNKLLEVISAVSDVGVLGTLLLPELLFKTLYELQTDKIESIIREGHVV